MTGWEESHHVAAAEMLHYSTCIVREMLCGWEPIWGMSISHVRVGTLVPFGAERPAAGEIVTNVSASFAKQTKRCRCARVPMVSFRPSSPGVCGVLFARELRRFVRETITYQE